MPLPFLLLLASVIAGAAPLRQTTPALAGYGFEELLGGPSRLAEALGEARAKSATARWFVRITATYAELQGDPGSSPAWRALDDKVARYGQLGVAVMLAVVDPPIDAGGADSWREFCRVLALRYRGRIAVYQIEALPAIAGLAREYAFALKSASVQIRAADPAARIAQATAPGVDLWPRALYAEDTAPYVDVVVAASFGDATALAAVAAERDPTAQVVTVNVLIGATRPQEAAATWLAEALSRIDRPGAVFSTLAGADEIAAIVGVVSSLGDLFSDRTVGLDEAGAKFRIMDGSRDVTSEVPHRLLMNLSSTSTFIAVWNLTRDVSVSLVQPGSSRPVVHDPVRSTSFPAQGVARDASTSEIRFLLPASSAPIVVAFAASAGELFIDQASATGASLPGVDEIVARHREQLARQDAAYRTYIASARMEQHFRATATEIFDVVSENRFFVSRDTVEWEELSFAVNGGRFGADRPAFPLLQAEKVLALPLDLRLTSDYRYEFAGVDQIDGRRCYVVAFQPVAGSEAGYRGRVWIDAATWHRVRLNTIHTAAQAPVVSSEEVQTYGVAGTINGEAIHLPVRIDTTELVLVAGRNLVLEKRTTFSDFRFDAATFDEERGAARASDRIMFRDTPAGLRYLVKENGERVVSDRLTSRSRALAMGATFDPSFSYPLPIVGLNYLDFDFVGRSQLALLFGGVLALGNIQVPALGASGFDASLDFFGIAVPSSDIVFGHSGERSDERVLTIPASAGLNLGRQLGAFQKVTFGYQFRFDAYFADRTTDEAFVVPPTGTSHGATIDYQLTRRGYQFRAGVGLFRRTSWRAWGPAGDLQDPRAQYARYSLSLSKDFFLAPFHTVRATASWFGGDRLDRFSMYQFGLFSDVRVHGVPSAGVRFPELALVAVSYSLNVVEIFRFDLFAEHAVGRDPVDRGRVERISGFGLALNMRGPWRTMLRADIGRSVLPARYAVASPWVLQIMLLKPLK